MDPLVEALLAENYRVQLAHEYEETTWENHGFVRVKDAGGRVLAESAKFQHNPFSLHKEERTKDLMAVIKAGLLSPTEEDQEEKAACLTEEDGKAKEPESSDSESSTKVPSDGGVA